MTTTTSDEKVDKWTEFYQSAVKDGIELLWPSETLVRLFKGNYIPGMDKQYAGRRVLDVGLGAGQNLTFLGSLGLELFGTEVSEGICNIAKQKLLKLGHRPDLRVGTNRSLPFPDNYFDFLVSWSVIHYENTETDMRSAISEYHRVLKPGGRFFVLTTGPEHMILKDSVTLGAHLYQIQREDDFRKGQVFFYFDSPNYIRYFFEDKFVDVLVGRTHDSLFTEILDSFVITGIKPKSE